MKMLKENLERVTSHNKKVMERKMRESQEDKHSILAAKDSAAEERRINLLKKNLDRVAEHNQKVKERRRTLSTEMHDTRKSLCIQLESKQQSALQKREECLK